MTKLLHQSAVVERHLTDAKGKARLDAYGQPQYAKPVTVKCRKEPYVSRGKNGYGQYSNCTTTYYFDETVQVSAGDKVDGYEVQIVEAYHNGLGTLIGFRVDV